MYTSSRFRNAFRGFFGFNQNGYFARHKIVNPGLDYRHMLTGRKNLLGVVQEIQGYHPEESPERYKYLRKLGEIKTSSAKTPTKISDSDKSKDGMGEVRG
jgi:hypothetical protein